MLYQVEECKEENLNDRIKCDKEFVMALCRDQLQVPGLRDENIINTVRLGKRTDSIKRPLLVRLDSAITKNRIMSCTKNMRDAEGIFSQINIDHDYTKAQRQQKKELLEKAKRTEEADQSGNFIYRVRGPPDQMRVKQILKNK